MRQFSDKERNGWGWIILTVGILCIGLGNPWVMALGVQLMIGSNNILKRIV